jgi:erythromycin esterase-like protein
MSRSQSGSEYGSLFEKATDETGFVDEQDESAAESVREIADEIESYVEQTARDDGFDEAVETPDTDAG